MVRKSEDYEDIAYEDEEVEEPPRRRRRRRARGFRETLGIYCGGAILLLAAVSSCLIVLSFTDLADVIGNPAENFLDVFGLETSGEPEVVDTQIIVRGIRARSLLLTATGDIDVHKTVKNERGMLPDVEMNIVYQGSVNVGIDLSQITEEDVTINPDNTVTIRMPPVQIISCALEPVDIDSGSCIGTNCADIRDDLQDEAYVRAMADLLAVATNNIEPTRVTSGQEFVEAPLLDFAYQNAESVLVDFLSSFEFDRIEFQPSDETIPADASCYPS